MIGHDNCAHGGSSADPAFLYQEGRSFHMGNFGSAADGGSPLYAEHCTNPTGPKGNKIPCMMQIEGQAYIRNITTASLHCTGSGENPPVDACAEMVELRGTVAAQEERLVAQEALLAEQAGRIAKLEKGLREVLQLDGDDQ